MEEEGQPMPVLLKGVFIRLSRIYLCIYIYIRNGVQVFTGHITVTSFTSVLQTTQHPTQPIRGNLEHILAAILFLLVKIEEPSLLLSLLSALAC